MKTEDTFINDQEVEKLGEPKSAELDTGEDLSERAEVPDERAEIEDHAPEPEQSLEFLVGGERYAQD